MNLNGRGRILSWIYLLLGIWAGPLASGQENSVGPHPQDPQSEVEELKKRVEKLEKKIPSDHEGEVDLLEREVPYHPTARASQPLSRPWFENLQFSGFEAFDFLATGKDGTRQKGGFLVKQGSLFLNADVWTDTSLYAELQIPPFGEDDEISIQTGELYGHFRNLLKSLGDDLLSIKAGRMYIPFGEEIHAINASSNPLILNSAAFPYGFDEGLQLYGAISCFGWNVAVMNGNETRSFDDNWDKAVTAKIYGNPFSWLYFSGSFMRNGKTRESAFEFGESPFVPVGATDFSSVGASPSNTVDAYLYELDGKWIIAERGYLSLSFGQAFAVDRHAEFNREIFWFAVEGLYNITSKIYAAVRYSEIGTYKSTKGYHFDGPITAGGNEAFGFDANRFQRLSIGAGWRPNPHVVLKCEFGGDRFHVIVGSPFHPANDQRNFAGVELVLIF
ncbi:MAG: hypothetical protein HY717_15625 [Planctomycetes bacterium]|nr:hypothetical protein [Planctomycetota bacterium]